MGSAFVTVPRYGRVGAVAALAAVLFLGFRLYHLGPQLEGLEQKRAALARKQDELAQAHRDREALARFQNRVDDLTLRLGRLGAALPEREDVSELLRRLQFLAVRSNLTIRAFRPQPAVARDLHTEWSYRVRLDGTYHNLARFFDRIGGLSRIITIGDLVIRGADAQEADLTISAECTATILVPIEPSPPGAGGPGGDPAREWPGAPQTLIGYEPDGRRDPFVSPILRSSGGPAGERPGGLAGLGVDEAVLRGVVTSREGYLAVLEAPDARTYVARAGDRLYDAAVGEITGDAVILLMDAAAPTAAEGREVRKRLHGMESER